MDTTENLPLLIRQADWVNGVPESLIYIDSTLIKQCYINMVEKKEIEFDTIMRDYYRFDPFLNLEYVRSLLLKIINKNIPAQNNKILEYLLNIYMAEDLIKFYFEMLLNGDDVDFVPLFDKSKDLIKYLFSFSDVNITNILLLIVKHENQKISEKISTMLIELNVINIDEIDIDSVITNYNDTLCMGQGETDFSRNIRQTIRSVSPQIKL